MRIDLQRLEQIPGWFYPLDRTLFGWCLDWQSSHGVSGDLVELGVYQGKTAIFLGSRLNSGETLVACDLFGNAASETDIGHNTSVFYAKNLQRSHFEANYLSFFDALPRIVEGPASAILDHVAPHSARFVHIDASHAYSNVREDILSSQVMLSAGGLLVLDDYRSAHTPGVVAAVWDTVFHHGLVPICVSGVKFYASWGDSRGLQDALCSWLTSQKQKYDIHEVGGHRLVRVCAPSPSPKRPALPAAGLGELAGQATP